MMPGAREPGRDIVDQAKQSVTFNCSACGQAADALLEDLRHAGEFPCPNPECGHAFPLSSTFHSEASWLLNEMEKAEQGCAAGRTSLAGARREPGGR